MGVIIRWYKLLNFLMSNKYASIQDLEKCLNVSQQTVKTSIATLNNELGNVAEIIEIDHNYYLSINNFIEFEKVLNGSIKVNSDYNSASKRQGYILKQLINQTDYIQIQQLSENLAVSRGTVNNDINSIKGILSITNLEILSVPNKGILLTGSEFEKRLIAVYYSVDYFGTEVVNESQIKFLNGFQSKYHYRRSDNLLLIKVIDLTLSRIIKGFHLNEPIPYYINYSRETALYDELILFIETEFKITLNEFERDFITFPLNLSGNNFQIDSEIINENRILLDIFSLIVENIEKNYLLNIDRKMFFEETSNHLLFLINRVIFKFQTNDLFHGEIEKKYPLSYQLAKDSLTILEDYFQTYVSPVEADYLSLYFELINKETNYGSNKKEIAIICNTGKGTAGMVRRQIEKVIGQDIKISQFSESNYENQDLSKYFVLITTIPLKNIPKDIPTIRLSNVFNDQYLSDEWEKLVLSKSNLLRYSKVFFNRSAEISYEKVLNNMINELINHNLVNNDYKIRLSKREKKSPVLINNGIAFPHEINDLSDDIIISVTSLEKPVFVFDNQVELILLLAIPSKLKMDDNTLIELYDFVFRIVNNDSLKNRIMKMSSTEELNEYLREEEE